jgi:hypothetical protein
MAVLPQPSSPAALVAAPDPPRLRRKSVSLNERYDVRINEFLPPRHVHLFNEPKFFALHSASESDTYAQLVRRSDGMVFATLAFHETERGVFASPSRGTFGGLSFDPDTALPDLESFVAQVLSQIKLVGAHTVHLKCAPMSHGLPELSLTSSILLRLGADLTACDLNYDMRVDKRAFDERVDHGNAKRIRKCQRSGFVSAPVPQEQHERAYELIRENRFRRGYAITMSAQQMALMTSTFPEQIHYFAIYEDTKLLQMLAAAICLQLTSEILYVFYWGDAPDMTTYSPIALLASEIYKHCQHQNIALLDVGTATVAGKPNYGLVAFKRNLGFAASLKTTFSLHL